MTDAERRCGTCEHWGELAIHNALLGICSLPLPPLPICIGITREITRIVDGKRCPCWTARAEGEK